jgi:hypothetical protein
MNISTENKQLHLRNDAVTYPLVRSFKNTSLNTESGHTSCLTSMHFHYPGSTYHIYQNIRLLPPPKYSDNAHIIRI